MTAPTVEQLTAMILEARREPGIWRAEVQAKFLAGKIHAFLEQETVSDERDGAVAERSAARSEHLSSERRRGLEEAAKFCEEMAATLAHAPAFALTRAAARIRAMGQPTCQYCGGLGYVPGDPEGAYIEGCDYCKGTARSEHQSPAALDARTLEAAAKVADEYAAKTPDSSLRIGAQWIAQDIRALIPPSSEGGSPR
jgi:hypothetical protein